MLDKNVAMIGVPMDLGGVHRGVDMGPSALRIAGMEQAVRRLGIEVHDFGNIPVEVPESLEPVDLHARFKDQIALSCSRLRDRVVEVMELGNFPLVMGGDHSIACGTVAGMSAFHAARGESIGLIWFDAHGDMNTPESSPSGNIHGMPLAACLGRGLPELTGLAGANGAPMIDVKNAVVVGARSIDRSEKEEIQDLGLRVMTMREIDMRGIHDVMLEAFEIATQGTAGFHLSFDMDGCDPEVAPGVGTPVRGGLNFRECHLLMEMVAETESLLGLELTEINPILDRRNKTAKVAVDLTQSALGKIVL